MTLEPQMQNQCLKESTVTGDHAEMNIEKQVSVEGHHMQINLDGNI